MVDGAGAELDRQRNRARLRELVAVEAEGEAVVTAGFEVAAGLTRVEGAALQEDVGGLGELGRLGSTSASRKSRYASASANSGGVAWAPRNVGIPPAALIARNDASSVSRSSP